MARQTGATKRRHEVTSSGKPPDQGSHVYREAGMMKPKFAAPAGALVALALALGPAAGPEKVVNVYNWSDNIDESVLEELEKETGIEAVHTVLHSNQVLAHTQPVARTASNGSGPTDDSRRRHLQARAP